MVCQVAASLLQWYPNWTEGGYYVVAVVLHGVARVMLVAVLD